MKHIEAILIKFAMTFSVLFVILGLMYGVQVFVIFILSAVITVIGFVGDLLLYPRTSNKIATSGDLVLTFLVVWLLGEWLIDNPDFSLLMAAFSSALLMAAGEWFFHLYMKKRVWEQKETSHTLKQEPNRK